MSTISFNRSSRLNVNPNMHVGKPKKPVALEADQFNLNKAIIALNTAKHATDHNTFMAQTTEAFRLIRNIVNTNR
jgi:hypothetical protein